MTIIKNGANLNENFTIASNETINDVRLSHKAIGIWLRLASKKSSWEISISGLRSMYPEDGMESVRSGLKELCKFGYLVREPGVKEKGRFSKCVMTLGQRPLHGEVLTETQVEFLFSKKVTSGLATEEDFQKMFPKRKTRHGDAPSKNCTQINIDKLNTNTLSRKRACEKEEIHENSHPTKGVHKIGTLPKKEILEAEDGLPSISISATQIDTLVKHAMESGIAHKDAKSLVDEVITAYRLECGANQAIHDKPYWAIRKWLMHAVKRYKEELTKGHKLSLSKKAAELPSHLNTVLENRPKPVSFSKEALDQFFS